MDLDCADGYGAQKFDEGLPFLPGMEHIGRHPQEENWYFDLGQHLLVRFGVAHGRVEGDYLGKFGWIFRRHI